MPTFDDRQVVLTTCGISPGFGSSKVHEGRPGLAHAEGTHFGPQKEYKTVGNDSQPDRGELFLSTQPARHGRAQIDLSTMLVAPSFVSRRARGPHPDPKAEDHQHRHPRKGMLLRKPAIAGGVGFFFAAAAAVVGLWGLALLLLHRRLPRLESSMTGLDPFLPIEAPIGMPSRIVFYSPASKLSAQQPRQPMLPLSRPDLVVVAANSTGPTVHGGRSSETRRSSSKQRQIPAALHYEEDLVLHIKSGRRSSPVACRPPAWSFLHFPNCNRFHEVDLAAMPQNDDGSMSHHDTTRVEEEDSYVIARGYYRDVWVLVGLASAAASSGNNKVVLKTTRFRHDVDVDSLMSAKRDALVMERLASHGNIVSAFGHCGTSTVVEALPYEVEQYVVPKETSGRRSDNSNSNRYTPIEKVRMALEMAESLAALHGFAGGAISHNDVQLSQWLRSRTDRLVLGDFHSSRILSWNHQQQSYCPYSTGTVFGNVRTVE
jgi:serine/threonine protein kinase